jgi:hypothetical protein
VRTPPRSPERQQLAAAISRRREAEERLRRVEEADQRALDQRIDLNQRLLPAAEEALKDARAEAPRVLVAALLADEEPGPSAVDIALEEVARLERRLAEAEEASRLLDTELRQAREVVWHPDAHAPLNNAVNAALAGEPVVAALRARRERHYRCGLRDDRILKTLGLDDRYEFHDAETGLRLRTDDIPLPIGASSAFVPDESFKAALARLRIDADAPLPGLPDDAADDDGGTGAAAGGASAHQAT